MCGHGTLSEGEVPQDEVSVLTSTIMLYNKQDR